MDNLTKVLEALPKEGKGIIVIDGKAASGKSTLADGLADFFNGDIIRMDDFFLPKELRTTERRAIPGGNVHYERFIQEVVKPLLKGEKFQYNVFNCHIMDYDAKVSIDPSKIVIIEGAYSMHPEILKVAGDLYRFKIFMDIQEEIQKDRILKRNGNGCLKTFQELWIPLENIYIEKCHIKEQCDLIME